MPYSTFTRRLKKQASENRSALLSYIRSGASAPVLHWIDNFDKLYVANSVYVDKELS